MMLKLFLFLALAAIAAAKHEEVDGHSLYKVTVHSIEQTEYLNNLVEELNLDRWSVSIPGRHGLILVPKELKQQFEDVLFTAGIDYSIDVENIKETLDLEDELLAAAAAKSNTTAHSLSFDEIHRYDVVDTYLVELAERYPNVQVVSGGRSFEGRDMKYLKISTTNFQDRRKPVIMMQSLLHAREWVSLPTTLYAIKRLVIDVTDDDLVNDIDWIILPIANPDGYEFSHTRTRMWRKNRASGYMVGDICMGVDLNRNFDIFWGTASSPNVCMDDFHGSRAFSEPETSIIRDIIHEHIDRLELFLDMHSFGSMILYGYGNGQLPPNALTLNLVGVRMAQRIDAVKWEAHPNYVVGNVVLIIRYMASGGAMDYAHGVGTPLSYTYELPAYNNLNTINGFLVDPDFIEQVGYETWEGIKQAARFVLDVNK